MARARRTRGASASALTRPADGRARTGSRTSFCARAAPTFTTTGSRASLPWTSPEIKQAFENYGNVIADSAGGASNVIATDFQDGGNGLFSDPPTCLFHHQATFMTEFFKSQAGARDGEYDFFPFPTIDARFGNDVTGAGDLFGMFRDTPQSRALMSYLLTPEAQSIWVARGGALSVNVNVTDYPDDISNVQRRS